MDAVSYTHLDVYKRQTYPRTGSRYISEDVAEEIPALIGNMTRYPLSLIHILFFCG